MGKQGFLGDLCRSLDRMEEEMRGVCGLFRKRKQHPCSKRPPQHRPEHPCCPPPGCRPPCGRECFCCAGKEDACG